MSEEDDRRLGELAIQAGLLSPRELARAMREHRTSGKPLAETLVDLRLLTPEQAHALGGGAKVEKAAVTAAAAPPPSRPRRVMRVMWRRMSPLGRVWFMVLVLLIVILAISIPLTLLWPGAPPAVRPPPAPESPR